MCVRSFRIEDEVCDYLMSCHYAEQRTKKRRQKSRYFNEYLQRLTPDQRTYLTNRYMKELIIPIDETLEKQTVEEIKEIETAIKFMYGEITDKLDFVEEGLELSFDELLDVLEV